MVLTHSWYWFGHSTKLPFWVGNQEFPDGCPMLIPTDQRGHWLIYHWIG
jgi:hypothetical protein